MELAYWRPDQLHEFNRRASQVLAYGVALGVLPAQTARTLRFYPEFESIGSRLARVITNLVDVHDPVYMDRVHPTDRGSPSAVVSQQLAWIDPNFYPSPLPRSALRHVAKQPGGGQGEFDAVLTQFLSTLEAECDRREALRPPRPRPRMSGMTPRAAEHLACEWMLHLGVADAVVTQQSVDGGVDVSSSTVVAQVKHYAAPVGVESLRALHGAAAVSQRRAVFFTLTGYTRSAISFGDAAKMPLFIYSAQGASLIAANPLARICLDAGLGALGRF